jgi:hypothetical protein
MAFSKLVQLFISKKMVEEHCSVVKTDYRINAGMTYTKEEYKHPN